MLKSGTHISERTLRRLAVGTLSPPISAAAKRHISACNDCREKYQKLIRILEPSYTTAECAPSDELERRIISSYHDLIETPRRETWAKLTATLRGVTALYRPAHLAWAMACLIAVAGVVIFITADMFTGSRAIPISITYIKGKAYINNQELSPHSKITENSAIKVPKNSTVVLSYNNKFTIKIHDESVLEIKKANARKNGTQVDFVFNLKKGNVFTRLDDLNAGSNYYYITPNAHITSSRTEFVLKVIGNKTIAIAKSGTLLIKSLESDEEVLTIPDKKYEITSSIEFNDVNDYDDTAIDTLKNIDSPCNDGNLGEPPAFIDTTQGT